MYDVALLKTGLIGATPLLSWRQNPDATGVQINDANLIATPTSGLYFNDFHPLLTPDNLFSIRPDFMLSQTGTTLNTSFSLWLRQKTEAAIIKAVAAWLSFKFDKRTAHNLLERDTLLKTATGDTKDMNGSKKVGREFVPKRSRGIKMTIKEVGIQLDENCTVTLYLYHHGAMVSSQAVTYIGNGQTQWTTVNWILNGEGSYLIFYDQSQNAGVQSINGIYDNVADSGGYCVPCGKYFTSTEFEVSSVTDVPLSYTDGTNHGLNFKLTVECDYTAFILDQKNLFTDLIGYQLAMDMLREMAYNPNCRVNRNASNMAESQKLILYEIDGDSQGRKGGLSLKFEQAMKTVQFDETGIENPCLNCRRRGPRFTSV
jgi:hypothetical protein